jgi:hypothetical protein
MQRQAAMVLAPTLLTGLALLAAACGSKSSAGTRQPAATIARASVVTSKAPVGLLTAVKCRRLYDIAESFSAALTGDGQELGKTAALLTDFAGKTPADIRPDFQVLADAYTRIVVALKGADARSSSLPSADTLRRMAKLSNQIDMGKVSTANTEISVWSARNCQNYVVDTVQH